MIGCLASAQSQIVLGKGWSYRQHFMSLASLVEANASCLVVARQCRDPVVPVLRFALIPKNYDLAKKQSHEMHPGDVKSIFEIRFCV